MTDKSILEQALLQVQTLEEAVKANAKGILSSTMKKELSDILKESMEDEDEDENSTPEVEDTDDVSDEDNTSDEDGENNLDNVPTKGIDDVNPDDEEEDPADDLETGGFGDEEGVEPDSEENVLDMTKASHDEVLKVFKAMKPEDGIIVKKDGNKIEFNDGESDYIIKLDDDGDIDGVEDTDVEDTDVEDTEISTPGFGNDMENDEEGNEDEDNDFGLNESKFGPFEKKVKGKRTGDVAEGENSPFEKKVKGKRTGDVAEGENSPFEKKISGKKTEVAEGENSPFEKKVKGKRTEVAEGDNSPYDNKPKLNSKVKPGKSVDMEEEVEGDEETVYEIELDGESEEGDQNESARTNGNGYHAGLKSKKKYYAGNKRDELQEAENVKLRKQVAEYKKALILFKEKLNEVALFNGNLFNMVTLYTENSTTKNEKLNIMKRFDKVSTITESKNLFETISSELKNKKPITETVVNKISSTPSTSSTEVLSEAKAYENPQFKRMKDLMTKIK